MTTHLPVARLAAVLLLGMTLLSACRPSGTPGAGGGSAEPSVERSPEAAGTDGARNGPSPSPDVSLEGADLVGIFGGDPQLEGGCAWIDAEDGQRYEVSYPEGWEVTFDPVALIDPAGEIRAEEGDRIGLNGEVAGDLLSICQIGPIFRATEVITDG